MDTVSAYEELYNPIVGTSDEHRDDPALTPQHLLDRTVKLKETFTELKTELLDEVIMMDSRVIRPAMDAKEYLQPLRKTIKKRENKRLDWERYIDKVNTAQRKLKRTDRENAALAKAEEELGRAADVCNLSLCFTRVVKIRDRFEVDELAIVSDVATHSNFTYV